MGRVQLLSMQNKRKHILIVDDSLDNQTLLKMLLEAKGYNVDCTSNGEEALCLLHSGTKLPDIILLDLRMPVMDGFDFRQLQCEDPSLKHIPVIIMSGDDNTSVTKLKTNSEVLQKPLNISTLMATLERNVFRNSQSEQSIHLGRH